MSESVSGTLNKKIHLTIFPLFPSMSWLFLQQTLLSQKLKKTNQKERGARVRTCQGQGLALLCFAFVQNSLSVAQHPFFSLTYLSPWPALYNILKASLQPTLLHSHDFSKEKFFEAAYLQTIFHFACNIQHANLMNDDVRNAFLIHPSLCLKAKFPAPMR